MSASFSGSLPPSSGQAFERQVWGEFFGGLIGAARQARGLSIEEMARRTGITEAEWAAMEEGTVPGTLDRLQAIAAGLDIAWQDMVPFLWFCRQAWCG
jgi:transcriptional regulator with XRE-family HTH domain